MADIINNNIYGGAIIPSSFVFDFVHYGPYYNSYDENKVSNKDGLINNEDWESMAIGRHCLIKYCNYAFTTEERNAIEQGSEPSDKTSNEYLYYTCFKVDGDRSYDGLIVQKTKDGPLMIGYTNHGINTDDLAADIQSQVDSIRNKTDNAKITADSAKEMADKAINTLGYELNNEKSNTVDKRFNDITVAIGSPTDKDTTIYGSINSLNKEVSETLVVHINDFEGRTRWDAQQKEDKSWEGNVLKLSTQLPNENTREGTISIVDDNIYYGKKLLSRSSKFTEKKFSAGEGASAIKTDIAFGAYNKDEENNLFEIGNGSISETGNGTTQINAFAVGRDNTLKGVEGIVPQVQVEGTNGYSSPNVPVKICIGSTAPTSTENDITIWIKTK